MMGTISSKNHPGNTFLSSRGFYTFLLDLVAVDPHELPQIGSSIIIFPLKNNHEMDLTRPYPQKIPVNHCFPKKETYPPSAWPCENHHSTRVLSLRYVLFKSPYPLVHVYMTMENHLFQWVNQRTKWPWLQSLFLCLPGRVFLG